MEKKIYQILAGFALLLGGLSVFFIQWETQWIVPVALFTLTGLFLLATKELKKVVFLIILFLPFLFNFNYLKFQPFSFLNLGGLSEFPLNLSVALYLVLILFFVVSLLANLRTMGEAPMFVIVGMMVVFFSLSIFWSDYRQISLIQLIYFITPFAAYFLAFNILKNREDFLQLLLVTIFSAFLPVMLGFYQIATGDYFYEADSIYRRISGPFYHPNNFGLFLFVIIAFSILFLYALDFDKVKNRARSAVALFMIPVGVILIFTYSRTSWIGIVIFVLLLSLKKTGQFIKTGLLICLIFSSLLFFEAPRERIVGIFQRSLYDSVYVREEIFKIALQKMGEKPVIGYGIGTFEEIVRSVKENFNSSSFPHNDFSLLALEGGIVGAVLFLVYSVQFLRHSLKRFALNHKRTKEKVVFLGRKIFFNQALYGRGIVFLVLSVFVIGIAEATFRQTVMQIIFWFSIGGWFAFTEIENKS